MTAPIMKVVEYFMAVGRKWVSNEKTDRQTDRQETHKTHRWMV